MSVNKAILLGRLGADPELKDVGSTQVCDLSVATNESWKDKDGNKQERTEWHRVQFWGRAATVLHEYLRKGSQIYIEGRIQTRKYEDRDGNTRYTTEIVGKEFKFIGSNGNATNSSNQSTSASDDDLPF